MRKIPHPWEMREYAFCAFESMEQFLFDGIQEFYRTGVAANSIPANDPSNEFLNLRRGGNVLTDEHLQFFNELQPAGVTIQDYYVHKLSPINPDRIFRLERAITYFMNRYMSLESRQLGSYWPHVDRRQVDDDGAGHVALHPASSDSSDGELDAMDIDQEEEEDGGAEGDSIAVYFHQDGRPMNHAVAQPMWAHPRLTYRLNEMATFAEMLAILPLPIPIGAFIPDEAFADLMPEAPCYLPPFPTLKTALLTTEKLQRLEKAAVLVQGATETAEIDEDVDPESVGMTPMRRELPADMAAYRTRRNNRRGSGTRPYVVDVAHIENAPDPTQSMAQLHDRVLATPRLLSEVEEEEQEPEPIVVVDVGEDNILDANLMAVKEKQIRVVQKALDTMRLRFQKRKYAELTVEWGRDEEERSTTDFMPLSEFLPPRDIHANDGLTQLEVARKRLDELKGKINLTPDKEREIMGAVDIFPAWMIERNEFLEKRGPLQMETALQRVRMELELKSIQEDPGLSELQRDDKLDETERRHYQERHEWLSRNMKAFNETFYGTVRASPAFLAVSRYTNAHIYPNREKAVPKPDRYNGRPYIPTRQMYTDTYRSAQLVTKQNAIYMERAHMCSFHCMRWMPHRDAAALNYTDVGEAGVGKSFCLDVAKQLTPDGVVCDTTNETTASYNVDQDFDGFVIIYQEMDSNLLFSNKNKNDTGATDKINFAKARMTSFFTRTKVFQVDEETKKRTAVDCFSSQHIVTMGATNQILSAMDRNMKRRLLIDYVSELVNETDGGQAHDLTQPLRIVEQVRLDHREIFCAYTYVETTIRAGILPDLYDRPAKAFLMHVLKKLKQQRGVTISNPGHMSWVMEMARILSLQHACFRGLFSPEAFALYKASKTVKRWTPEMFHKYIGPYLYIGKDQVIHALTMLDFLYCSRDEDRLFASIALRACHIGDPKRRFRRVAGTTTEGWEPDYNYLSFTGSSGIDLCKSIVNCHKHIGKYRAEDIRPKLDPYINHRRPTKGLYPEVENGEVVGLRHYRPDDGVKEEERAIILFDDDGQSAAGARKSTHQFCISIEFLEERFGFNIEEDDFADVAEKIKAKDEEQEATLFQVPKGTEEAYEYLNKLVQCSDERAPMVKSIRDALGMPTLERSPYEHDTLLPILPEWFRYCTFYMPDDVTLLFENGQKVRVPLDGTCTQLQAARNPDGPLLMQENYTKPLPTARISLYHDAPDDTEMAFGTVYDEFDVDYYAAVEQMRRLGHPGLPELHQFYIDACVDEHPELPREEYLRQLYDEIPELHPHSGVPLPFAFPPIAFRIERYLAKHIYHWEPLAHYPACNLYERLHGTAFRTEGKLHGNANGAFEKMSVRHGHATQRERAKRKLAHLTEHGDFEEFARPPKRPRLPPQQQSKQAEYMVNHMRHHRLQQHNEREDSPLISDGEIDALDVS